MDVFRNLNGKNTHWINMTFLVLVDRSKVINGEPHKFDEIGWFALDKLPIPRHSVVPIVLEKFKHEILKKNFKKWIKSHYCADERQPDSDSIGACGSGLKIRK